MKLTLFILKEDSVTLEVIEKREVLKSLKIEIKDERKNEGIGYYAFCVNGNKITMQVKKAKIIKCEDLPKQEKTIYDFSKPLEKRDKDLRLGFEINRYVYSFINAREKDDKLQRIEVLIDYTKEHFHLLFAGEKAFHHIDIRGENYPESFIR